MSKAKKVSRAPATATHPNGRSKAKEGAKKSMKRAMARGKVTQAREALDLEFMALRETNAKPREVKQKAVVEHSMDDLASFMGGL
ncbi:unnamed protein product [Peniophora sp. CBMAI 1063]|nr:unnamed protein product [Peniophora sp. CBMAI 1063]